MSHGEHLPCQNCCIWWMKFCSHKEHVCFVFVCACVCSVFNMWIMWVFLRFWKDELYFRVTQQIEEFTIVKSIRSTFGLTRDMSTEPQWRIRNQLDTSIRFVVAVISAVYMFVVVIGIYLLGDNRTNDIRFLQMTFVSISIECVYFSITCYYDRRTVVGFVLMFHHDDYAKFRVFVFVFFVISGSFLAFWAFYSIYCASFLCLFAPLILIPISALGQTKTNCCMKYILAFYFGTCFSI